MGTLIVLALVVAGMWILVKEIPFLLKFMLYGAGIIILFVILFNLLPVLLAGGGFLLMIIIFAVIKLRDSKYSEGYSSSGGGYVLNKKSGVIHNSWDSSVDTISYNHKRNISYSEAQDLVNRGTKYRFKQDP